MVDINKNNSLLDQTVNDFEDNKVSFRFPKNRAGESQVTESKIKSRGRAKKSSKLALKNRSTISSQSKSVVSTIDLSEESSQSISSHLGENDNHTIEDLELNSKSIDDLSELEKSICSESEKLCPSCRYLVLISEYSSHVSNCLQKFSYSKDKSNLKESSRILPCPICFKAFTSVTEKQSHVKLCGYSHGLSPQQLIEASKLQTKQEEERLAMGLPSPHMIQQPKETRKRSDASKSKESKSSDPEMQLAFALSRSLVEEERKNREIEEDKLVSLGLHDILQEKRRKLVLPQPAPLPSSSKGTRGLKGKKKGKPVTVLMRRTQEDRESIITEKVAAILAGEFELPVIHSPESGSCVKQSSNFINDDRYDKESRLWKFTSTGLEVPSTSYYVVELAEYVKPEALPFAELLLKYSSIPGKMNCTALAEDSDEESEEYEAEAPIETTVVDAYCTQLALAELLCSQDVDDLTFNTEVHVGDKNNDCVDDLHGIAAHIDTRVEQTTVATTTTTTNNNNTLPVLYGSESIGKDNNHETILQTSDAVEKNSKATHDVELVYLSSDDDNSKSLTVSFSPRKIENEIELPKLTGISSPQAPAQNVDKAKHIVGSSSPGSYSKAKHIVETSSTTGSSSMVEHIAPSSKVEHIVAPSSTNGASSKIEHIVAPSSTNGSSSKVEQLDIPFSSKLIYDWSRLLANGKKSDIFIQTEESEILVHSLVLLCRCSKILSDVTEESCSMKENLSDKKRVLNWSKFSYDAAYAFIVYLYTGGCPVKEKDNDGTWLGMHDLALKYGCSELIKHLESMYKSPSNDDTENEFSENPEECRNLELEKENIEETPSFVKKYNYLQQQETPLSAVRGSGSPDIFGDWSSGDRSLPLLDSVIVTPPGVNLDENTLQSLKSPILNLESTSSFIFDPVDSTNDSATKLDQESVVENGIKVENGINSAGNGKCKEAPSKRNLSLEFKEAADIPLDNSFADNPKSPPLQMSSFSDMDYPSVNEIVDLTISSESDNDKDLAAEKEDNSGYPADYEKKDISLPDLGSQGYNKYTNLSSLINKPGPSAVQNTSLDLNIEIPSPKNPSDSDIAHNKPYPGLSDDSLLKAVCNIENNLQKLEYKELGKKNLKNPREKLYKSKSCMEYSPSSMITPNKGIQNIPSSSDFNITPMPDYKSMLSPELKKELDKYGIKRMSRKKAITLLLHIYEETHPFVTDSETEQSFVDSPIITKPTLLSPSKPRGKVKESRVLLGKKTNFTKSCDDDLSSQSSNTSANTSFDCLEETFLPSSQDEMEDNSATQNVSLENHIKTFIRSDDELYSKILQYEPIWVNELHKDLKLNGIKCSIAKLITFLDEQCITFRFPSNDRSRKRRRKASPGRSPKKKKKI